jgi:hypothetical protein
MCLGQDLEERLTKASRMLRVNKSAVIKRSLEAYLIVPDDFQSGPELKARAQIDAALGAAGWIVQDREAMNLAAGRGVAVREFKLTSGHGFADYLLFVGGKAVGVLEGKLADLSGSSVLTNES